MNIKIRYIKKSDIENLHIAFQNQGWDKPVALFEQYLKEQYDTTKNNGSKSDICSDQQRFNYS